MRNLLFSGAAALVFLPVGLLADPVTLEWVNPGNNPVGYFYVSPYTAQVQGTGQLLSLYCIDFGHEVAPPYEWQANIFSFDLADVTKYQYGQVPGWTPAFAWNDYKIAAWLINQSSEVTGSNATALHQEAVDQYAAWEVFIGSQAEWNLFNSSVAASGDPTFAAEITAEYNAAVRAVNNGWQPWGWEIVTPFPAGQPGSTQEFLVDPPTSVPEPSAVVLLGTILGCLLMVARKHMRRRA
jgi:hypothetical protein